MSEPGPGPARPNRTPGGHADNGITAVRLGLALAVVWSHAFVVGGFGPDPLLLVTGGQLQLGSAAVISFFGLSGFLLARSRERSAVVAYVRNRFLRIVPAVWVCVIATVVVVVPAAVAMGGTADPAEVRHYAIAALTFQLEAVPIQGLYGANALPDWVNGPLWTLPPEVICYALLGFLRGRVLATGGALIFVLAAAANARAGGVDLYLHLPAAFFAGVTLYAFRDRIPMTALGACLAAVGLIGAAWSGSLAILAPVLLPYLAVVVGLRFPVRLKRDLSYGVYIYAWPLQQLLAMAGATALGVTVYFATTLLPLFVLAFLSWTLIEAPALRRRARTQSMREERASMTSQPAS